MPTPKIVVTFDLSELFTFQRKTLKEHGHTIRKLAAERLLQYEKRRFLALSRGMGSWRPLTKSRIRHKRAENARYGFTAPPHWILYQSGTLYSSLGIRETKDESIVGVVAASRGPPTYRGRRASQIAAYHNPIRPIMGTPPEATRKAMQADIRKELDKEIRRNKKNGK